MQKERKWLIGETLSDQENEIDILNSTDDEEFQK